MTREEMIGEIIRSWGLRGAGDDLNFLLNSPEAWGEMWLREDAAEKAHRRAWLANASPAWLPIVQDIISNPPDLPMLEVEYRPDIDKLWPYTDFDEECWLLQISGMLSVWAEREPAEVAPMIVQVDQRLSEFPS